MHNKNIYKIINNRYDLSKNNKNRFKWLNFIIGGINCDWNIRLHTSIIKSSTKHQYFHHRKSKSDRKPNPLELIFLEIFNKISILLFNASLFNLRETNNGIYIC